MNDRALKLKIYTKTGDKGQTSLYTGQRILKNDPLIEAVGSIDECNCAIGVAISRLPTDDALDYTRKQLITVQHALFDLGAAVATPRTTASESKIAKTRFDDESIRWIETWIDEMEAKLPPLHTFILPGGDQSGAFLHLARSVCRRAEREIINLFLRGDVPEQVLIYLNRLSDYLFVCSRYVNMVTHSPEQPWEPHHHIQKNG